MNPFKRSSNIFLKGGTVTAVTPKIDVVDSFPLNTELQKLTREAARARHGFRISMTLTGASFALLAIPVVGLFVAPVMAGIMLLAAGGFFAYRRLIAGKIDRLKKTKTLDNSNFDWENTAPQFKIPSINWKEDLKEGIHCLSVVGAIKIYTKEFFSTLHIARSFRRLTRCLKKPKPQNSILHTDNGKNNGKKSNGKKSQIGLRKQKNLTLEIF